ncbi:MAG: rod shape-determining protein MreD [Spirochaetaceae bacterium]|jgi:rod shape-determining protein MreD|nr:rod shape-determining protein MreD [Spirochaetaceae bacterium]
MIKSFIWSSVFLLFFVIFETAILSNIQALPVMPDLALLALLYISFRNGSFAGETSGFVSGLLLDFLSAAPLGLNSFIRTCAGFITGLFSGSFNMDAVFLPAFMGFAATLFKALMTWVLSFFFGSAIMVYSITSSAFWIEVILNTVLTPVIFALLSLFSSLLLVKEGGGNASD